MTTSSPWRPARFGTIIHELEIREHAARASDIQA